LHPGRGELGLTAGFPPELRCRACGRGYPITDGIPDLVVAADLDEECRQWDEQAPRYETGRARDPIYVAAVEASADAFRPRAGELVLDAGCGTGLTVRRYLRPGVRVVGLDLSPGSLRQLRHGPGGDAVALVRGDLREMPFANATFDRVLCANAIQQIPGAAERRRALAELARVARPGGRVVVSAHNLSVPRRRAGLPKEGPAGGHSGGVRYVYRFAQAEFAAELARVLAVERLSGAGFPLTYRFKLSPLSRVVERVLRRLPFAVAWGSMLVAVCRKE
jgi:SAM-dependent methyltransferase